MFKWRTRSKRVAAGLWPYVCILLLSFAGPQTKTALAHDPDLIPNMLEKVMPGVVAIDVIELKTESSDGKKKQPKPSTDPKFEEFFKDFFDGQRPGARKGTPRKRAGASKGSGFVIDASGFVVTSNHLLLKADKIFVGLPDGTRLEANIAGQDPKTDLALLKVKTEKPLTALELGDSDALRVGEQVFAIGNPFGLSQSVSMGMVSGKGRDINSGPYDSYIQTDAAANRGNDGGPLLNISGKVVGLMNALISPNGGSIGIGFAVPSKTVRQVTERLIKFGTVRRGWLGVRIQAVTDELALGLGLEKATGALVSDVTRGSPAEKGGILSGDVILRWGDTPIPKMRDLPRAVANSAAGDLVPVELLRKGERLLKVIEVGLLETEQKVTSKAAPPKKRIQILNVMGMHLRKMTPADRTKFNLKHDNQGLIVASIDEDSQAAEKRIAPGDVVIELEQKKFTSLEAVLAQMKSKKAEGRKSILALVSNKEGNLRFLALRIKSFGMVHAPGHGTGEPAAELTSRNVKLSDIQRYLADLGYDPGPIDGKMGAKTRQAIRAFQDKAGLEADGELSVSLQSALHKAIAARAAAKKNGGGDTEDLEGLSDLD